MKEVVVQIRVMAPPYGNEWCLALNLRCEAIEGIVQRAAGADGGAEWEMTEHFVRRAVHEALMGWAEKECAASVDRIRAERELRLMTLGRFHSDPVSEEWKREFIPEDVRQEARRILNERLKNDPNSARVLAEVTKESLR